MSIRESVIICTRNRQTDLKACLASLAKQTLQPQELIIVDSSDEPLNQNLDFKKWYSVQQFPETHLQYIHTTPGLTRQRNIGIAHANGKLIYFFDDDVVLENDYLAAMNKAFDEHPDYAGGMGDITNITQEVSWKYRWFRRLFLLPREHASGNFTWSGMPTHAYGTPYFKHVEVVGGCCMAFRCEVLENHKFDESFEGYSYMEDADIARCISRKAPLFYNPGAKLVHNESPTAREKEAAVSAMFAYNYSYLFFKHFFWQNPFTIIGYGWSLLGLMIEAVLFQRWQKLHGYAQGLSQYYKESQ